MLPESPILGLRAIFRRFWPQTRPLRGWWLLTLVLVGLAPALSAAAIWLFKVLIDEVVVPHDFHRFPVLACAYVGIALVQGVVSFTDQYLSTWVGEKFVLGLRTRLFDHLHRLPPGFFERRPLGDLLSRLTGDIGAIEELVLSGIAQGLTYVFQLGWFVSALFVLNWRLALASMVAAPGFLVAARFFSRRVKDVSRERRRRAGAMTSVAEESFSNAALVRAYNRRGSENTRFAEQNQASFTAQMSATKLAATFGQLTDLLEVLGVLFVIGLAVWELSNNRITVGGLLAFVAYLTQLYGPIQGAAGLTNSLYSASAGAERVIELLDEPPLVTDPTHPTPLTRARGFVRFDTVEFTYPDAAQPALRQVSFSVSPGEKLAVVGASGAGKSTVAKLLLRFNDPSAGSVSVDGIDVRELALVDLYRNIAVVLQETLVFDASIRDNIAWGRPEATDAEIVAAASAADAHEFILALPERYDTRVGQRGRMLSGGQRQRLAIARAMIRDAPILLLDEPTTGLDAESTQRVLAPLRRLMDGRTTIIISHNLLTITDADRILYLEGGEIHGSGTHAELLADTPGYANLYRVHQLERTEQVCADPTAEATTVVKEPAIRLAPALTAPREPALILDRVGFAYPGQPPTLMGVSTTVGPYRCLAILGQPGAGKTTLLRLIAGVHTPTFGRITLDGRPIDAHAATLVESFATTPPTSLTIAEHISAQNRVIPMERILAAAHAAGAHEPIMALPHAYATRPATLDQPMTQELLTRLAIARALVHSPTVLMLDEPTETLDRSARNRLLPTLARLTLGRITVLATRDPLVAAIADHRLWLEPPTRNALDTTRTDRTRLPGLPLPPRPR